MAICNISVCAGGVLSKSFVFNIVAPSTAGIDSINENLAAFSRLIPKANAVTMVLPLRDIPGKIAKA